MGGDTPAQDEERGELDLSDEDPPSSRRGLTPPEQLALTCPYLQAVALGGLDEDASLAGRDHG
jgi:hypothetical protein